MNGFLCSLIWMDPALSYQKPFSLRSDHQAVHMLHFPCKLQSELIPCIEKTLAEMEVNEM